MRENKLLLLHLFRFHCQHFATVIVIDIEKFVITSSFITAVTITYITQSTITEQRRKRIRLSCIQLNIIKFTWIEREKKMFLGTISNKK